ncbi:aminoacyl tRNA synthase complex-interacting multifunctional protein 1 [Impatiens glandulifera]|uniref:aminoacyl tRNA synthase complex-interacting multifunctional protein 1 n=1 Tax=Impatiens glandulifera TaxID=253017 RepID=UPI001FB19840|nr:aminoacyl tRNA synthase complex-interacting multifunctional protein 1 [Impatiens glandulifera]
MAILKQKDVLSRNQLIASALCKNLKLDYESFKDDTLQSDIKSLCEKIISCKIDDKEMKWISIAENFPVDSDSCLRTLTELNESLAPVSVIRGEGMKPSVDDIAVFSAVYPYVVSLPDSDRKTLPHLLRWVDYIQNKEDFGEAFEKIHVEKVNFAPPLPKTVEKVQVVDNTVKSGNNSEGKKPADKEKAKEVKVATVEKTKLPEKEKAKADKQTKQEKTKLPEKVEEKKDEETSVSLLRIQVGLIRKAWKHPSADSLLVEEIDVGEAKVRQVVSGLAKYCTPEELTNRQIVLITNVKPGKLRDVVSEGLVLCASNEDHTVVEPLIPPKGAKVGECVSFSGHDGKPEDVLNPKKKQLDKITPHLFTSEKGVATFKGIPFMTSDGPCTSSIPNASIK